MLKTKKLLSTFLTVLLLLSCFYTAFNISAVSYPVSGKIDGTDVRLRSTPTTKVSNNVVAAFSNEPVTVTGETVGPDDNMLWYAVTVDSTGQKGYIRSDFIKITPPETPVPPPEETTNKKGFVNDNDVNLRKGPGTSNQRIAVIPIETKVEILGEESDSSGNKWYHITCSVGENNYTGYMFATYITIQAEYTPNVDFEEYLTAQGFPESYKVKLRQLHALHPNWVFIADHLAMTWDEAFSVQSRPFHNLVQSKNESWKLMEEGTYNFNTGAYIAGDSGAWHAVHPDVVAYYLDPRNFLIDGGSVYQFIQMRYNSSYHTKEALQVMLNGTFMAGALPDAEGDMQTYADAIMAAARNNNMSPFDIAAAIIQEQGPGGGGGCISNNSGYYNFFNVGAYAHSGNTAVQNGINYAQKMGWNTRAKSINGGVAFFVKNYISRGQSTPYYKKFNVVATPYYVHQYMTNISAALSEGQNTQTAYATVIDQSLAFNIPVYKNMPETVAPYPNTTGNNDNFLEGIYIDGLSLSPSFSRFTYSYELIVPYECNMLDIAVTLRNASATVSGSGKRELQVGNNDLNIVVTATSGRQRTYTLHIYREPSSDKDDPEYTVNHYTAIVPEPVEGQTARNYITGIPAGTSIEVLKANIPVTSGTLRVLAPSGDERTDVVCTSDIIQILDLNNEVFIQFGAAVKGDINGDGKISLTDLSIIQRHLLEIDKLVDAKFWAADINGKSDVTITDLSMVQRHLLEIQAIS